MILFLINIYYNFKMKNDKAHRTMDEEFNSLFQGNPHQQSIQDHSDLNLLESTQNAQYNSITFKQVPVSQSESEDDLLDRVDQLLEQGEVSEKLTQRQIMLNYKANQLKMVCKSLKLANFKLLERINQLEKSHQTQDIEEKFQYENLQDHILNEDYSETQAEFEDIQMDLAQYKRQLIKYQQFVNVQLKYKGQENSKLKNQIFQLKRQVQKLDHDLKQKSRTISYLQNKNQELLLSIEDLQNEKQKEDQYFYSNKMNARNRRDAKFNEKISSEMENMIDKLLKELKHEKRFNQKNISEIKRLNNQIIELENQLKQKNNKIYDLELNILKINKVHIKQKSSFKYDINEGQFQNSNSKQDSYFNPQKALRMNHFMSEYMQGQQSSNINGMKQKLQNKNKSHVSSKSYNKNRVSAEREVNDQKVNIYYPNYQKVNINPTHNAAYHSNLSTLNKIYSNFTLMDLLNKQFKIRQAQKYVIACQIIQLYAKKIIQQNYENLISEQIQIHNFNPQNLKMLRVKVNNLEKEDNYEANEENVLYNMAFILDTLLNQVEVVDVYFDNQLDINIPEIIEIILTKNSKEEKYKILQDLLNSIENELSLG